MNAYILKMVNQLPIHVLADRYDEASTDGGLHFYRDSEPRGERLFQGGVLSVCQIGKANTQHGVIAVKGVTLCD